MRLVGEIGGKLEFEDAKKVGALHGFSPANLKIRLGKRSDGEK